jgi:hypothetical protein
VTAHRPKTKLYLLAERSQEKQSWQIKKSAPEVFVGVLAENFFGKQEADLVPLR